MFQKTGEKYRLVSTGFEGSLKVIQNQWKINKRDSLMYNFLLINKGIFQKTGISKWVAFDMPVSREQYGYMFCDGSAEEYFENFTTYIQKLLKLLHDTQISLLKLHSKIPA